MSKFGYTEKEIGHMTLNKWAALWEAYKSNFDNEMYLTQSRTTYEEATKPKTIDDIIPL